MWEGHYLLISKNYLADWLAAFPFSQAVGENVRAELLGYKSFSPLELAAAHSGRAAAYLATDCKRKGKTILFSSRFFNYPVGDIDLCLGDPRCYSIAKASLFLKREKLGYSVLKKAYIPLGWAWSKRVPSVSLCQALHSSTFNVTAS